MDKNEGRVTVGPSILDKSARQHKKVSSSLLPECQELQLNTIESFVNEVNRIGKEENIDDIKNFQKKISEQLRLLNANLNFSLKIFVVNNKDGTMKNHDNSRNISFRVDTINCLFDSITSKLIKNNVKKDIVHEVLFSSGVECGKKFGISFKKQMEDFANISMPEKIKNWCVFESDVGWGKFTYDNETKRVKIENCFQAKPFDGDDEFPQNCEFVKGYISGVLRKICGEQYDIEIECLKPCPKDRKSDKSQCFIQITSKKDL